MSAGDPFNFEGGNTFGYFGGANQGWVCPKCCRVYSPSTFECYHCNSPLKCLTPPEPNPPWDQKPWIKCTKCDGSGMMYESGGGTIDECGNRWGYVSSYKCPHCNWGWVNG